MNAVVPMRSLRLETRSQMLQSHKVYSIIEVSADSCEQTVIGSLL